MLDTDTKRRIDNARDILVGKVPDPKSQTQALPLILGSKRDADANYFDTCRVKRNTVEYDRIGATSDGEVVELIEFVDELRADVLVWLKKNHPALLGGN